MFKYSQMSSLTKVYLGFIAAFILFAILGLDSFKWIAFCGAFILTVYYAVKASRKIVRALLWRIRRKLILSYIFIGFIPLSLLTVLFALAFWTFMAQATSEMFNTALDGYLLQTKAEGTKLLHLLEVTDHDQVRQVWLEDLSAEDQKWLKYAQLVDYSAEGPQPIQGDSAPELKDWMKARAFSGLVLDESKLWLTSIHHDPDPGNQHSLLIRVPISASLLEMIEQKMGAHITYVSGGQGVKDELEITVGKSRDEPIWPVWWDLPVAWLSLPEQYNWNTGKRVAFAGEYRVSGSDEPLLDLGEERLSAAKKSPQNRSRLGAFALNTNVSRIYNHVFSRSTMLQKFVYALMIGIALFFLIIEIFSFISGFFLAKSITASVHNLFEGTERIKAGDFSYRIKVHAKDQLGDLAHSFNRMTESIQNLLKVRAEKERLAESLQIARQMQQNLLPREITSVGGIEIATMNIAAQEVCGDYYDIIPKNDEELGIIIADVSGKGPSAALYMAEVKGVMLSMSQRTISPSEILIEANRILAPTLDSRNFITMTYAMINEPKKMMKMCRAGHNPILHYDAPSGTVEVVQPKGIGLGLGRNGMFESTLEQIERKLNTGDILVFYTDGLTEAMNEQQQLYGLSRLTNILLKNKDYSSEEIKSAIFQDLQIFLNTGLPQDDITLVLLKIQ
jgi:serine phosphatase RsbU (regulator of sigma subunit)